MDDSIDRKVQFVANLLKVSDKESNELKNLYSGLPFNYEDEAIQKLIKKSNELCLKFKSLAEKKHKSNLGLKIDNLKRLEILRQLFCGKYMVCDVRSGINLIIGLVDAPSMTFFNYDVKFYPSLVKIEGGVEIAPKVEIGENIDLKEYANKGLPHIEIKKDVWLGLGVKVKNNVTINEKVVVGAGAFVETDIESESLALGRPAKVKRKITNEEKENRYGKGSPFTLDEENILYEAVSKWTKLKRIKFHNILEGNQFNLIDSRLMKLYKTTHTISEGLNANDLSLEERLKGIDYLFPLKGENLKIGHNLHLDMLGTSKIGNNVIIGDDVTIGGNLIVGDNVVIGNNTSLFASGHPIYSKRRKMMFKLKKGIVQIGQNDLIIIKDNVKIGNNVIIIPGSVVDRDIPDNVIFSKGKII
ncbi:MAG: hypothetical protein J6Y28_07690 [Acholeplasmatales bacterium]|nr:hypothetical protein [Acholeplasmatales bacterium]